MERRAAHQPLRPAKAHASLAKDARLPALHRGDFGPQGRVSVPGICALDRAASSSQTARSPARAGSRGLPSASLTLARDNSRDLACVTGRRYLTRILVRFTPQR